MPIQKIKAGRIITVPVNNYVGDKGTIFYDEDVAELRLSDGVTPGGILITSGGYVLPPATTSTLGGVKVGANLSVSPDGTLSANFSSGVTDAFKTIVTQGSPNLVAVGTDTLEIIAGPSISIVASSTSSPYKTITIGVSNFIGNLDGGGPDTEYGGTVNIDGGTV